MSSIDSSNVDDIEELYKDLLYDAIEIAREYKRNSMKVPRETALFLNKALKEGRKGFNDKEIERIRVIVDIRLTLDIFESKRIIKNDKLVKDLRGILNSLRIDNLLDKDLEAILDKLSPYAGRRPDIPEDEFVSELEALYAKALCMDSSSNSSNETATNSTPDIRILK